MSKKIKMKMIVEKKINKKKMEKTINRKLNTFRVNSIKSITNILLYFIG